MSYAQAAALQSAIYDRLRQDSRVMTLAGGAILDAPPPGPAPDIYVSLGPEDVRDRSDVQSGGARHEVTLSVISSAAGFERAKTLAGAVCDSLIDADLTLSRGRLIYLRFLRARAARGAAGQGRRIDLRFRAGLSDE